MYQIAGFKNITVISNYLSLELQPKIAVFSTNMASFLTKEVMKALRNSPRILKSCISSIYVSNCRLQRSILLQLVNTYH